MVHKRQLFILLVICAACLVNACSDPWKNHTKVDDPALASNLLELINSNSSLSKFSELLKKTGFDKEIASSKTYTVWAPDNKALESVDASVLNNDEKLRQFVGFHISHQSYFTRNLTAGQRITTLSGKNVTVSPNSIEGVTLTAADAYTGNGVLHVIGSALTPKVNAWELFQGLSGAGALQKTFMNTLMTRTFDVENSKQTGVNANGLPVYDSVFIERNQFLRSVANLENESRQYTFLVLNDAAYQAENSKLSKFFVDSTAAASAWLTQWNIIKDLAFEGIYEKASLPPVIYSTDSVKVTLAAADIVSSYPVSNGIVHVVNRLNYQMSDKIKPVIVEGEFPVEVRDARAITRRVRKDPSGKVFQDLLIQNHGVNGMWTRYRPRLNSGTYKVYWRVVRDTDLGLVPAAGATDLVHFPQKIVRDLPTAAGFGYKPAPVTKLTGNTFAPDYNEALLGELKVDRYGFVNLYLVGNTVTTNGQNTLLLDYLRLEPVY